ncbi:HAD-IA family hydrolase [Nocardioides sp. BP30]|uniref:HAD family hydrolase n=1 Tax=Nocardioides sp. BP30 TaxID=3036374 RepID=UPI002469247C|nr:HAD-IA family hydrolase [Nocardioides sp. BP30]WGL52557.1 HAD-IA family hydrolase [Nocardioides sp. BP30]
MLFDADGVLQHRPGGWETAFEEWLGVRAQDFLHEMFVAEKPAMSDQRDAVEILAEVLQRWGIDAPAEEVFAAVWLRIEPDPASLALVRRLRRAGYGVHLGTNQSRRRAAYMRTEVGYDELFDVSCYSAELRLAKPDPGYFTRAAELIAAPAAEVLFIDDLAENVAGAREAGMAAIHWHLREGHDLLEKQLAERGVVPAGT